MMERFETAALAEKIFEIERSYHKSASNADTNKWKLNDSVIMEISDDHMVFYLWKRFPDQARSFLKVVPRMMYQVNRIEKILDAQVWVCV